MSHTENHRPVDPRSDEEETRNRLFDTLASERRRTVLSVLSDGEFPVDLATLAEAVAARETGTPAEELTIDEIDRTRVSLYHVHLPKLAGADLVDYDADRKIVAGVDEDVGMLLP